MQDDTSIVPLESVAHVTHLVSLLGGVLPAFDDGRVANIKRFSELVLRSQKLRSNKSAVKLAYSFRGSALEVYRNCYRSLTPKGLIFQVAPSSTPITAIYTVIYFYLSGNKVITRLSPNVDSSIEEIVRVLLSCTFKEGCSLIACPLKFVTYLSESETSFEINHYLSEICDARYIWGSSETCDSFKRLPLRPGAVEYFFPSRHSLALINCDQLEQSTADVFDGTVTKFYSDCFEMHHEACSSPRVLYWYGTNSSRVADRFYERLEKLFFSKVVADYELSYKLEYGRYSFFKENLHYEARHRRFFSLVSLVREDATLHLKAYPGVFHEFYSDDVTSITSFYSVSLQTITVYGREGDSLVSNLPPGLMPHQMVVPEGEALSFREVWEGINFFISSCN